jgi:hypothetical protein
MSSNTYSGINFGINSENCDLRFDNHKYGHSAADYFIDSKLYPLIIQLSKITHELIRTVEWKGIDFRDVLAISENPTINHILYGY